MILDRKKIAQETVLIQRQGYYEVNNKRIDISKLQQESVKNSVLISPEESANLAVPSGKEDTFSKTKAFNIKDDLEKISEMETGFVNKNNTEILVENKDTVQATLDFFNEGKQNVGVLNFASAKNEGGGFLNGAKAQEESIAISSGLYDTLCANSKYYEINRKNKSMMYTDYAIYSPNVVFFRNPKLELIEVPATASVLTMPAVNMGQVILKGEDVKVAKEKMKNRMELCLRIFAQKGDKNLILGAYGCGVFRNNPKDIANWWNELLEGRYKGVFDTIMFAVLDHSKEQKCIKIFEEMYK